MSGNPFYEKATIHLAKKMGPRVKPAGDACGSGGWLLRFYRLAVVMPLNTSFCMPLLVWAM